MKLELNTENYFDVHNAYDARSNDELSETEEVPLAEERTIAQERSLAEERSLAGDILYTGTPSNDNRLKYDQNRTTEILLDEPVEPENEDCGSDIVPPDTTDLHGKKKITVPALISMTKVLFDRERLAFYSLLNRSLRNGTLHELTGWKFTTRVINKQVCSFPHVSYWRIDRENFYADVQVELKLSTTDGTKIWKGYIVCWCEFEDDEQFFARMEKAQTEQENKDPNQKTDSDSQQAGKRKLTIYLEELTDQVDRDPEEYEPLDKYLVPYATNRRVDQIAEKMWEKYHPAALTDPGERKAELLAEKMGLTIMHCPVYDHMGVDSMVFFKADRLSLGEDRTESDGKGGKRHIKAAHGVPEMIPANTIVVNSNRIRREYSSINIFHECYHHENHFLFYCLQELASNDFRQVPTREVIVDENEEVTDSVYFMEKQANRGSMGLMLPATDTRRMIAAECGKVKEYANTGELYETAGMQMGKTLALPDFRIRMRMIQLGHIEAKGAMNRANRVSIEPFAFDKDAWRDSDHTFIIDEKRVNGLAGKSLELQMLLDNGKYVYADGHVARNLPEFVRWDQAKERYFLTDKAKKNVDKCCLRFEQRYVQRNVGTYVYGRMYYDADYLKQNEFYLSDIINQNQVDELDARDLFEEMFPTDFKAAIKQLQKKNKCSNATLAADLKMDDSTFARALDNPRQYRNEDFLTILCLYFKLPDWISRLLFKRAHFQLDEDDKRHRAILHILRSQSNDGIEAANAYLKKVGQETLRFSF
ncbi:MAG: hypothetical protein IJV41_05520 [Oscillospiraceae bacterium]|nr:hypothetical protein [Oscillospiraceae bacterium]